MATAASKISLQTFRAQYADEKPYFELLNGEPVQKAMPTRLHSILHFVLASLINELGLSQDRS